MSWAQKCICDVCGGLKGDANHWLLAAHVRPFEEEYGEPCAFLAIAPWNDEAAKMPGVLHICSDVCKQKLLNKFLTPTPELVIRGGTLRAISQAREQTYVPIECEFCGANCLGGAEHHARVEAGDRYSDGGI